MSFKLSNMLSFFAEKENLLLQIAVAFPLLWAGVSQITNPTNWVGFVPLWLASFVDPEAFLGIHSFFNLFIGVGLLIGFWRILFSGAATLSLLLIVVFYGVDDVTFRDVGLAIIAFVLFLRAVKTRSMFGHPMSRH
ncbi:MAG: hypothetical protein HYW00_00745 [Candidatus Colwellbacteria bacterium]|nr:hypothetical protein [Candidatus Colwellbacteria bacterium]